MEQLKLETLLKAGAQISISFKDCKNEQEALQKIMATTGTNEVNKISVGPIDQELLRVSKNGLTVGALFPKVN